MCSCNEYESKRKGVRYVALYANTDQLYSCNEYERAPKKDSMHGSVLHVAKERSTPTCTTMSVDIPGGAF